MNFATQQEMNDEQVYLFLVEKKLLNKEIYCELPKEKMNLVACKRNSDGIAWRCYKNMCLKRDFYISVRKGSELEGIKIPLKKILNFCNFWSNKLYNQKR
jgi:hypothetical protein